MGGRGNDVASWYTLHQWLSFTTRLARMRRNRSFSDNVSALGGWTRCNFLSLSLDNVPQD
jgi:hypothetical protein